ncbi:ABC transporter permease [Nitratireductor sp. B36]|uniref:PhnE/PtxC family ABC transporter permease n=1 Tax=Nitratireductor sp. B36 TaxID=2762059 RepID=UPI001E415ADC|nr:ABC transporter permease subunit [Nitratireductor sp. B36]
MAEHRHMAPSRLSGITPLHFVVLVTLAAVILGSMGQVAPSPGQLAAGAPGMVNLVGRMMPPNLEPDFLWRIAVRILETFQIALVGAAIGIAISLPVGWLAARGVSPLGRGHYVFKMLTSLLRTVPDLVWALLFVATVGLGAVAGTMTIVVDTIGFCGRFFAEAMEDAEKEPQEALAAIGAGRGFHPSRRRVARCRALAHELGALRARKSRSLIRGARIGRCRRDWPGTEGRV